MARSARLKAFASAVERIEGALDGLDPEMRADALTWIFKAYHPPVQDTPPEPAQPLPPDGPGQ